LLDAEQVDDISFRIEGVDDSINRQLTGGGELSFLT
jgi:hypothetical protein